MESIFISIPAYRDEELIPTLEDLFNKASGKYSLHPHILLQEHIDDLNRKLSELQERFNNSINIIPVDITNVRGACWARHWLQQFITHQEYYLQLDSHHRFISNWDIKMLEQLHKCPPKSLLTAYPPPYIPPDEFPLHHVPTKLVPTGFDTNGVINIEGKLPIDSKVPIEGTLLAGGFILAPSNFCWEVPYDPELYFKGEEVSLAVRAWTSGWNIYHPSEILLYHYYTRSNSKKHWDDNITWSDLERISINRLKTLLDIEHIHPHIHLGIYGLGSIRTLSQYESKSGIDFKNKIITSHP